MLYFLPSLVNGTRVWDARRMVFQDLIGRLVEQLIDGDELTGFNELVGQYRIGWYGYEVWQLLAGGNGS